MWAEREITQPAEELTLCQAPQWLSVAGSRLARRQLPDRFFVCAYRQKRVENE
jgi:hypothetical protein